MVKDGNQNSLLHSDPIRNVRRKNLSIGIMVYFDYLLNLVYVEKYPYTINQLLKLKKKLTKPYPSRDTDKIQNDFRSFFSEDDCINGDLNTYWMNIVASSTTISKGKFKEITNKQIKLMEQSFFDYFKQYKFLESHINNYPIFYEEYLNHEKARMLTLYYLFLEKRY
ncbi:YxiJ family protein [Neobacillus sp. LXY-1]|uniref:YxiJ family protein n=1 Tax=Neobacillus sp. LXY-1 TaxID=3379133 RepID=UPI003EE33F99